MRIHYIAIVLLFLVACAPLTPVRVSNESMNETGLEGGPAEEPEEPEEPTEPEEPEQPEEPAEEAELAEVDDGTPKKEVVEGELVSFPNLSAVDPDGDPITYTFTSPLNEEGEWQTQVGDAGEYKVVITASDGVNTVSQDVLVIVIPENQPPEIRVNKHVTVFEGETITLEPVVSDPDGDVVDVSFSGFMSTANYTTTFDDEGTHKVQITAKDGTSATVEEVLILVKNQNRAPSLSPVDDASITEGEKVTIKPAGTDPDGDKVTFRFASPLNEGGEWSTQVGDAGTYNIDVFATDGDLEAKETFVLIVEALNKAPVIEHAGLVTVSEGDTITLAPVITDPEGEEISVSYAGWMTSSTYTTNFNDAGEHTVTVVATDTAGNEARKDITVRVEDVNRPPTFGDGAFS